MTTIKDRFILIINKLNLNQSDLARIVGSSREWAKQAMENEIKNIGIDKVEKLYMEFANLNADWLLRGEGEMLKKNVEESVSIRQEHSGVGDNNASLSRCEQEVAHLRELLAEKERLIQVLLNK